MTCSAELFAELRGHQEFAFLVALARAVNALKFGVAAMAATGDAVTPATERQRFQAFLYLSGVLHEVFEFKIRSHDKVGDLAAYRGAFKVLEVAALDLKTRELISKIRNRTAFHFDLDIVERTLPKMPPENLCFLAGYGRHSSEANYELASIVTFAFAFGHLDDLERAYGNFGKYFDLLLTIVRQFATNADQIIMQRLAALGIALIERPSGTYLASRQEEH